MMNGTATTTAEGHRPSNGGLVLIGSCRQLSTTGMDLGHAKQRAFSLGGENAREKRLMTGTREKGSKHEKKDFKG